MKPVVIRFDQLRTQREVRRVPRWARYFPTLWVIYAALSPKQQAVRERRFLHRVYVDRARAKLSAYWASYLEGRLFEALKGG